MLWDVYVDLARHLTTGEQRLLADAIEDIVPSGCCIGPNKLGDYEVYFTVEAPATQEAQAEAARSIDAAIRKADVKLAYTITLQRHP